MLRTSIPGFFHIEFYDSGPTNKHAEQMVCALRCALPVAAEILPRMFHALSWRSAARLSFCQCSSARYLFSAATLVPWTVRPTGHIMAIDFASTIARCQQIFATSAYVAVSVCWTRRHRPLCEGTKRLQAIVWLLACQQLVVVCEDALGQIVFATCEVGARSSTTDFKSWGLPAAHRVDRIVTSPHDDEPETHRDVAMAALMQFGLPINIGF